MEIRALTPRDLDGLAEIAGTIDSSAYVHVEQTGEGLSLGWRVEERPLRAKRLSPNPIDDDERFLLRQIASGAEEGTALLAEHDGAAVALLVAQPNPSHGTVRVIDVRVDVDYRRQGLATALLYRVINAAREAGVRAVAAEVRTDNAPACRLLSKCGFDLAGIDTRRHTNHDLVKESATLFWYATLE